MRKLLFIVLFTQILFLSHAQIKIYGKLNKEDIDIKALIDQYSKDADSENFILYKLSTTAPNSLKKDIEDNFVIENYNKKIAYPDNSQYAMRLSKVLFDSLTMRKPLPTEAANFIYFEAKMNRTLIPDMICGTISKKNRGFKGTLVTDPFKNLFDMGLVAIPDLIDAKNQMVKFGDECKVTTSIDGNTDIMTVLIAVKIDDSFENIVNRGEIKFKAVVYAPIQLSITKKDVGKDLKMNGLIFSVLEFDGGVVHLKSRKQFSSYLTKCDLIADIDNKKFKIKNSSVPVLFSAYNEYRATPKLDYTKFIKTRDSRRRQINTSDLNFNVDLFNIGYDIDSLMIIDPLAQTSAFSDYIVSVTKNDNEDYTFRTIARTVKDDVSEEVEKYIEKVKTYVRNQVKYPVEAQERRIEGAVEFRFIITPEGKLVDLKFVNYVHDSFETEITRVIKNAPLFKRVDNHANYNQFCTMRIVFNL